MTKFESFLQQIGEVGVITKMVPGLIFVEGLPHVKVGEIIIVENEIEGRVLTVNETEIKVMLLGDELKVKPGQRVTRTGDSLKILVGDHLLGQNIDSLGKVVGHHGQEAQAQGEWRNVEVAPPGLEVRSSSKDRLDTGVALVDLMIPLAHGQRELVIGDKKTGKSQFVLDTMISQAKQGTVCIYAGISRKQSALHSAQNAIKKAKVEQQCIFVTSHLGDNPGTIFMTPYTAMTVAEYFRDQRKNVLVIFDNLSVHAEYYREIALLAQEFPGKEAYPGDIFYIHSRLMERAGSFMVSGQRASITCLPIAETSEGDLAGYIQTNLMSMTDGHLFFDIDIFLTGRKPAVNLLLSVTRVGRQTQTQLEHELGNKLLELVGEYQKAQGYLRFGAELSGRLREILDRGTRLETTLDQQYDELIDRPLGTILAGLLWASTWPVEKTAALKKLYYSSKDFQDAVADLIVTSPTFDEFIVQLKERQASWEPIL